MRPRFDLRGLLLLMIICSLGAAAASYLFQALRGGGRAYQFTFILLTLVSPVALLVLVSIARRWAEYRDEKAEDEREDRDPLA